MALVLLRLSLMTVLLFPVTSLAQQTWVTITSPVNLHSAPNRDSSVVTWLRQSTRVDVAGCLADKPWCRIVWGRREGWVHVQYLGGLRRERVPVVVP